MASIKNVGKVVLTSHMTLAADEIKYENYKVNSPYKYKKHVQDVTVGSWFETQLAELINVDKRKIGWVFFSACKGAEPHVDMLDENKFHDTTYVVPVILPKKGKAVITAEGDSMEVSVGEVYQFDHTKIHSMLLDDTQSGCVVIMAAILKDSWLEAKE